MSSQFLVGIVFTNGWSGDVVPDEQQHGLEEVPEFALGFFAGPNQLGQSDKDHGYQHRSDDFQDHELGDLHVQGFDHVIDGSSSSRKVDERVCRTAKLRNLEVSISGQQTRDFKISRILDMANEVTCFKRTVSRSVAL